MYIIKLLYLSLSYIAISSMLQDVDAVTIMSIDFGSEWMKIAVVAPGIPMEIALNKESKRKTPVAISFRDGERMFGDDALTAGMRSPASSYAYILDLLGKQVHHPLVEQFQKRFPYYNIEEDPVRKTVVFRHDHNTTYSVEELCAQILNNARELAAAHTNQMVKDVVITVPPNFNQAERRAILTSAELANLKVLSLMNSNAAVGLNYGMFRRKEINETAQNIIFYDMGATATIATVASYQTIKTKEKSYAETNPQVSVLGVGYDRTLGGLEMQLRLRDFLASQFNQMKKTKNDVFKSPRALAKLMKAAGKAKNVLSANHEHIVQVEGVLDDQDLKLRVSREEFENLCTDLFERVQDPVNQALISAGIDISDIHQFIIVGGSTRIPKIQNILQDIWGKELGKNINADEAASLGAVYRAADLGQGFKVMKFHVKETVIFPIDVDFEREVKGDESSVKVKVVKRSLFARANFYPQKKVMTFNKHVSDFGFTNNYGDLAHLSSSQNKLLGVKNISYALVTGVTSAFNKHIADGAESKGIKAHFHLDDSGLMTISSIEAVFDKNVTVKNEESEESTLSKIGSTLSKLFQGTADDNSTDTANATNTEEKSETKEDTNKTEKEDFKLKLITIKEELNFTINYLDVKELTTQEMKDSRQKLKAIDDEEADRKEKEKARNNLESYILDINDKFSQNEYIAATPSETVSLIKKLAAQLEEWLYEEGFHESTKVYRQKIAKLEKEFEPVKERVKEHRERPEALKALNDMINMSSSFLNVGLNSPDGQKWLTDAELKSLDALIISTQKWLETKEEEQEKLLLSDDPKLTLYGIADKIASLDREVKYLVNKARLAKIKKEKEDAEAKVKAAMEELEKKKNETKEETLAENDTDSSRKEPAMPEEPETQTQENDKENDRRKDGEETLAHEEM